MSAIDAKRALYTCKRALYKVERDVLTLAAQGFMSAIDAQNREEDYEKVNWREKRRRVAEL